MSETAHNHAHSGAHSIAVVDVTAIMRKAVDNYYKQKEKTSFPERELLKNSLNDVRRVMMEHKPRSALLFVTPEGMPPEAEPLMGRFKEICEGMGLGYNEVSKGESLSVVRHAIKGTGSSGRPAIITSDDAMYGTFLGDDIYFEDVSTLVRYTSDTFKRDYGFSHRYIPSLYSVIGHETLGLESIPLAGPMITSEWLKSSKGSFLDHARTMKGRSADSFRAHEGIYIENSKNLLSLMKAPAPMVSSERQAPDDEKLRVLYEKNELFELLPKEKTAGHQVHTNRISAVDAIEDVKKSSVISIYFEMDDKDINKLLGIGISDGKVSHGFPLDFSEDFDEQWLMNAIKPIVESSAYKKVSNSASSYYRATAKAGIKAGSLLSDATVLPYTTNAVMGRLGFEKLAEKFIPNVEFSRNPYRISKSNGENASGNYLAGRADATLRMNRRLYAYAQKEPGVLACYRKQEEPLARILVGMERKGMYVDKKQLFDYQDVITDRIEGIVKQVNSQLPESEQVKGLGNNELHQLLFNHFKLQPVDYTRSGQPSVSEEALSNLENQHWLPAVAKEYKTYKSLMEKTLTPILRRLDGDKERLHPTFNQCVTVTGRLSASNPNVHAIPVRSAEGRRIREAFVASEGNLLVAADYSQIELRVLAHISGDETLCKAFLNGDDPHATTASLVFDTPLHEVTGEQRRNAKAINFGIIYGLTPFGLAKDLNVSEKEASHYIDRYMASHPKIASFLERVSDEGLKNGYVETISGRKISLDLKQNMTRTEINSAKRRARNYPMQGSASDIVKKAMINLDQELSHSVPQADILIQVHDELIVECPKEMAPTVEVKMKKIMEEAVPLSVPLEVDSDIGISWEASHDINSKVASPEEEPEPVVG